MAQTTKDEMPTRTSGTDPAEGSRDTSGDSGSRGGGITNRGVDREREEQQHLPERGTSQAEANDAGATDAGKTSGGGSLGHDQPRAVTDQTPIRNRANDRPDQGNRVSDDPVMPADDPALGTKI